MMRIKKSIFIFILAMIFSSVKSFAQDTGEVELVKYINIGLNCYTIVKILSN